MEIVIDDINRFKAAFNAIAGLIYDARIEIDHKGFRLNALDPSHISFAALDLKPHFFDRFACEPTKIFVDIEELNRIINRVREDDLIILKVEDSKLVVIFENVATRRFELQQFKEEYEPPNKPDLTYNEFTEIPAYILKIAIEDALLLNDKTTFKLDPDRLHLITVGEYKTSKFNYLHGELIKTNSKSVHSLEKLKHMVKACEFADVARIGMGNDMPLSLEFESETQDGSISFLLAPRIEAEE